MESTIGQRLSINDCCHLEIDRGRYLAIDGDGEYFISAIPQLIRGMPIEGPQTPTVFEGAKPGNRTFRFFVVDRGEALDLVLIGTLLVYDCWIWVAGTGECIDYLATYYFPQFHSSPNFFFSFLSVAIRNENGEEDDDEFEEYLPIMVQRYPKEMPPNMSVKEVMVPAITLTHLHCLFVCVIWI